MASLIRHELCLPESGVPNREQRPVVYTEDDAREELFIGDVVRARGQQYRVTAFIWNKSGDGDLEVVSYVVEPA